MRITDESGSRIVSPSTGGVWASDGVAWHEVVNVGDSTAVYLIFEAKGAAPETERLEIIVPSQPPGS